MLAIGCGPVAHLEPRSANLQALKHIVSERFGVEFDVPAAWVYSGPRTNQGGEEVTGADGYVKITALAGPRSLAEACETEAGHRLQRYGPNPHVEVMIKVAGRVGCRITPTTKDAAQRGIPAGLITFYDPPLMIEPSERFPRPYDWLVIWTDPPHLPLIERTLRFRSYKHA